MKDGVVLFDPERNIAHHLNGPATLVWEIADGRELVGIRDLVARIMEIRQEEAEPIARSAAEQLVGIHALHE